MLFTPPHKQKKLFSQSLSREDGWAHTIIPPALAGCSSPHHINKKSSYARAYLVRMDGLEPSTLLL